MSINNKNVLLTGAGSGIGRCLAAELAKRGAFLILTDINQQALDETVSMYQLQAQVLGTVVSNFLDDGGVDATLEQAFLLTDKIDILFCNAGMMAMGQVKNMPWTDFQRMQKVNQNTPKELTYKLLPHMIANGGGQIAYTCSASALVSPPGSAFYSMTKAALMAFSESLRSEVHNKNIAITTICPGFVRTPLAQNMAYRDEKSKLRTQNVPAFIGFSPEHIAKKAVKALIKRKPLVTTGSDEKFKRLMRYLSYPLYTRFNHLFAKALLDD